MALGRSDTQPLNAIVERGRVVQVTTTLPLVDCQIYPWI